MQPGSEKPVRRHSGPQAKAADGTGPRAAQSLLDLSEARPDLSSLREAAAGCRECPLGEPATQTVWGEGAGAAKLMLVGEQPGDREDLEGRPFVGPAGRMLDRALEVLGWRRDLLYVTNAVKHFKFEVRGKRRMHKTPGQREAAACLHWLEGEIAAVQPAAIVALGAVAARSVLGRTVSVLRERGQWLRRDDGIPVLLTLHPSALLRGDRAQLEEAFDAWVADLRHAGSHLQGL
jgi:DNA polymerase